jgi:tetraacyldisaccharide 4''-kinase
LRGADVIVADDGLQHLRLARDYELAVVDGARGLGNRRMLPAGPLREPEARLETTQAIVVTQRDAGKTQPEPVTVRLRNPLQLAARFTLGDAVNLVSGERRALAAFAGLRDLHAIAGIGHPEAFFTALRTHGLGFVPHALADHVALDPAALPFPRGASVLMTEKDAVKCAGFRQPEWWWVELDVTFDRADAQMLLSSILERTGLAGAGVTPGG